MKKLIKNIKNKNKLIFKCFKSFFMIFINHGQILQINQLLKKLNNH